MSNKEIKEKILNNFATEAVEYEQNQDWKRAGIRWEHCSKTAHAPKNKGFYAYSAFFCYRRAYDIKKATTMIRLAKNKYILIGDKTTAAMCAAELEALQDDNRIKHIQRVKQRTLINNLQSQKEEIRK